MNEIVTWAWQLIQDNAGELAATAAKEGISKGGETVAQSAKELWSKVDWHTSESKYRQALMSQTRTTKILGNPKPIPIENIYTDVYVFERLSAFRRYAEENLDRADDDDVDLYSSFEYKDRVSADTVVKSGENLFILGKPGAGKTTFLKHLTLLACGDRIKRTPIFVSIKDWSDSDKTLLKFIAQQFDVCGFPDAEKFVVASLLKGYCLVLLDGLDEVNEQSGRRAQATKEIINFVRKYRNAQYCVTCRIAASDYSFEQFKYVEVADFTEDQQQAFVRQWYVNDEKRLDKFLAGWKEEQNKGLKELGKTPLLLTLLCLAFDETMTFPARQVELYREAVDALLRKWDSSRLIERDRFYKNLSHTRREHLLEHIASSFYFNSKTVFKKAELEATVSAFISTLPDKDIDSVADAAVVVRAIEAQHGILVERAKNIYSFSHLTIQEFFTASAIVKNQKPALLRQIVKSALTDRKWREVMLYTVGLLPSADEVLAEMTKQLQDVKGKDTGILLFLGYCFCDFRTRLDQGTGRSSVYGSVDIAELLQEIESHVDKVAHPSLRIDEFKSVVEQVEQLEALMTSKSSKYNFGIAPDMAKAAGRLVKGKATDSAKMLGGYFVKPAKFVNYLYGCRLLTECLEIGTTTRRSSLSGQILSVTGEDLLTIQSVVKVH